MPTSHARSTRLGPPGSETPSRVAERLLRDEPALLTSLDFGPFVAQGTGTGPRIVIGDQSEIPLLRPGPDNTLDHRMAILAKDRDLVVLRRPDPVFAGYINRTLKRPDVRFLAAGIDMTQPVARLCRQEPTLRQSLQDLLERNEGVTLMSYLTSGNTWRLAQALGDASMREVHVSGPGPRMTRRANDKLWFTALARRVLGRRSVPPTLFAYGPAAAAGLVRRFAQSADQVVIKVPDSAGAQGNIRLESARINAVSAAALRRFLLLRLGAIGWSGHYPLLVGVWERGVIASPSVQLWLPRPEEGPPRVEGIFEQRVAGQRGSFVGGSRSDLPAPIQARLEREALLIAAVLQRTGYYGRCSFDTVLVNEDSGAPRPHWIECNARWGGMSIPMTAAQDLCGGVAPPGTVILQSRVPGAALTTETLLGALDDLLFCPGRDSEGLVVISPPQITPHGTRINLMALAGAPARADALMEQALPRVAALSAASAGQTDTRPAQV